MKISACIITFNEEKKIADCLRSLNFCDEIIVLDSFSSDSTLKIIENFSENKIFLPTIRLYSQEFLGYTKQKNLCLEKATSEWILSLDADERISEELKTSILAWKENSQENPPSFNSYRLNRLTWYVSGWIKHSGWYPDNKIRLFKKNTGKWEGVNLHERYVDASAKTSFLSGDILHYSFDSISDHIATIERFTTIAAEEALAKGKKTSILGILGHSVWTFLKMYFFRLGFLDGSRGFILAGMSAFHVWAKYSKLYMLRKKSFL